MAKQMIDLGLVDGGVVDDIAVSGGDLVMIESTEEHQRQLLLNDKGDFKENPTVCVGIFSYLDDESPEDLVRVASVEFTRDGMTVTTMQLGSDGRLDVNAGY